MRRIAASKAANRTFGVLRIGGRVEFSGGWYYIQIALTGLLSIPPLAGEAQQQPSCGDPPRVDDQSLKGDLDGKARFLSSLVGDAGLKGQIETARTDIFSKYPNADKTRSDAYPEYMACSFVLSDPKLAAAEKFR